MTGLAQIQTIPVQTEAAQAVSAQEGVQSMPADNSAPEKTAAASSSKSATAKTAAKTKGKTAPAKAMPAAEAADTAAEDTVVFNPATVHLTMEKPKDMAPRGTVLNQESDPTSWVILGLVAIFVALALRFRGNFKFAMTLGKQLTEGPGRSNIFDDTMHETTFSLLLNLLAIASGGVVLWQSVGYFAKPGVLGGSGMLAALGICLVCAAGLYLFQRIAYFA